MGISLKTGSSPHAEYPWVDLFVNHGYVFKRFVFLHFTLLLAGLILLLCDWRLTCSTAIENVWSFGQDSMQLILSLTLKKIGDEREIVEFASGGPGLGWFWMEFFLTFNHHPWHPGIKNINKPQGMPRGVQEMSQDKMAKPWTAIAVNLHQSLRFFLPAFLLLNEGCSWAYHRQRL